LWVILSILIGDGDSWFDYPLPDPLHSTDVLRSPETLGNPSPAILKLAHYSDATTTLLGVTRRDRLITQLSDPANGPIDAILFSGGGNDLVGDQFRLWLNDASAVGDDATEGVNLSRLGDIFGVVESAYLDLIRVRNQFAPHTPIFVHAYDFAIPSGISACHLAGPWLRPSLVDRGWPDVHAGQVIVNSILVRFRDRLLQLAGRPDNNMVLVETQGTLDADDWANELHPTGTGFDKIAARFRVALADRFPQRI
jgi:hypothetical protein